MYDHILFDLDGTLTDPGEGITNSVAYALEKWHIQEPDRTKLYRFIGPPLDESFMKYYGFSWAQAQRAVEYYREYFQDRGIFENEVYEGIEELLQKLKAAGKQIILATSKPEEYAKRILIHFGLNRYFDFVAGATMDGKRQKKADVIFYALANCGITDLARVVMIGDREHDVLGARQAGVDSIGVLYGYGDRQELEAAGATCIADTVAGILPLLLS